MTTSTDIATIERAGDALIAAVASPAKVILFGPHARGTGDPGTDYRFLVIAAEVENRFRESAQLDKLLGRLRISADVFIVTEEEANRPQPKGGLIHDALTTGRIVAES